MEEITVKNLTDKIQSSIKSIDTSIKSNKFGMRAISELTKQKSILANHINDLLDKGEVNEEDEKNTTRLIAIASTKQLSAEPKSSDNGLIAAVVVLFAAVAIFYYFKKD